MIFIYLICLLVTLYSVLTWVLPIVIAAIVGRRLGATIKIKRFGLLYCRLYDVDYVADGVRVSIDEIGLHSSCINSNVSKLITLAVKNVRLYATTAASSSCMENGHAKKVLDFRDRKIPRFVAVFVQFMAVHVYSVSVHYHPQMMLDECTSKRAYSTIPYIVAIAKELHVDGSIVQNWQTLIANLNVFEIDMKFLRYVNDVEETLCRLTFTFTVEAAMVAQGLLAFQKLAIGVWHTQAVIASRLLYDMLLERRRTPNVANPSAQWCQDLRERWHPIIPNNFALQMGQISVYGMREYAQSDFVSKLTNVTINYGCYGSQHRQMLAFLVFDKWTVRNVKEQLLLVKRIKIDAKIVDASIEVRLLLNTLIVNYDHELIFHWMYQHFARKANSRAGEMLADHCGPNAQNVGHAGKLFAVVDFMLATYTANFRAEMTNANALMKFANSNVNGGQLISSVGIDVFKCVFNHDFKRRAHPNYECDLFVENVWWSFKDCCNNPETFKKMHFWGTPFYMGTIALHGKCKTEGGSHTECIVESIRAELSPAVIDHLEELVKALKLYRAMWGARNCAPSRGARTRAPLVVDCRLHQINCFFATASTNEFFILRIDSLKVERSVAGLAVDVDECKALMNRTSTTHYNCVRADEIRECKLHIQHAAAFRRASSWRVQFLSKAVLRWSANSHLKLLYLVREIGAFYSHLTCDARVAAGRDELRVEVSGTGDFSVDVEISEKHTIRAAVRAFNSSFTATTSTDHRDVDIGVVGAMLTLDGDPICEVNQLFFRPVSDATTLATIRSERREMGSFRELVNQAYVLRIDVLRIVFPYHHQFAEAVNDELQALIKWLKLVHDMRPDASRFRSPLPSDCLINVKAFTLEMADDPFEMKLRDNFELLVDEYNESIKRKTKLADKVQELLKKHLHLPAGKVDELYANLQQKNAQIYIQRSKQLERTGSERGAASRRRCLFTWSMENIEIMILADSSIHGEQNVLRVMQEIDADSPWPEEVASFSILWCRMVSLRSEEWRIQLRDFPQPLLLISQWYICGLLAGAEQSAMGRAQRDVIVDLGDPFRPAHIARGLLPLKFYHDFTCEIRSFSYAFGPCWEPVIAQCNLSCEKIISPSKDPSPALPFWDKMRLLLHGRLTAEVQQMTVLLHASLDPYNTTEEMELTWASALMDWTDGRFVFKGDLNIFVRTASKYDDCQLLHMPNVKLVVAIDWASLGDPKDHHSVVQCAPDKLPEYSSNHLHDSFRAFRSQHCNLAVTLETKAPPGVADQQSTPPILSLYGSTLRWFENLKLILQGVTRPTRRGRIFNNVRCRKLPLSRHYRSIHFLLSLHKFQVCYWMSFAMQRGCEFLGGRLASTSQHELSLRPIEDGLVHRHRAHWSVVYVTSELMDSEIWLKCALMAENADGNESEAERGLGYRQPVEKCYCLSVAKVSYLREPHNNYELQQQQQQQQQQKQQQQQQQQQEQEQQQQQQQQQQRKHQQGGADLPTHRLVVYDLKGAWTTSNRNVVFALFDTFTKNQQMKKNLSTDALKSTRKDSRSALPPQQPQMNAAAAARMISGSISSSSTTTTSSTSSGMLPEANAEDGDDACAAVGDNAGVECEKRGEDVLPINLLQQLITEVDNKNVVFSDDLSSATRQQHLQGFQSCQSDDVLHKSWNIVLINAQVLLKGCETKGYVIMSAAKAEIVQRIHRPVWKECTSLVSKSTWVGALDCMQYYATVNAKENDIINDNIMWLTVDNIQEKEFSTITRIPEVPNMVGCGVSVGAVVSDTVGAASADAGIEQPIQLQRIVSRCKCEFFYVGYGDSSAVDVSSVLAGEQLPPQPQDDFEPLFTNPRRQSPVDAFTLMHHDLDVCTNSLQYAMLLDIVNNLLLHVDTHRKEALERLARMRFQLQLLQNQSIDDQRKSIQMLQTKVRASLTRLRRLEKDTYLLHKVHADGAHDSHAHAEIDVLERAVHECKNMLNAQAEELDMVLSCYKDSQLLATNRLSRARNHVIRVVRANEIFFKHAQWRLTEADGQIGIADLVLTNFLYTKNAKSDDSMEHLLELGYLRMTNLLPNQVYKEVLQPTEIQSNMPVEHKRVVRIFCRERPPVGGIAVKEHFEINVVPLTIGLTKKFYATMLKFCFPERSAVTDPDSLDDDEPIEGDRLSSSSSSSGARRKIHSAAMAKRLNSDSNFYVAIADDVEKMKQRAEKNKLFIYIKIPEVPVRLSYKGNKEKNLEDIRDFSLIIPTLEYHNVTWTWLDLLLAIRSDSRKVILSQAIKQKLQFKRNIGSGHDESASPHEEDKARMLFGIRQLSETDKNSKKKCSRQSTQWR